MCLKLWSVISVVLHIMYDFKTSFCVHAHWFLTKCEFFLQRKIDQQTHTFSLRTYFKMSFGRYAYALKMFQKRLWKDADILFILLLWKESVWAWVYTDLPQDFLLCCYLYRKRHPLCKYWNLEFVFAFLAKKRSDGISKYTRSP